MAVDRTQQGDDTIIYTLIAKGGGIDGRDHTDKGGQIMNASFMKSDLLKDKNLPWGDIKAEVVNLKDARRTALAKLTKVDKLVLGLEKEKP